MDARAIASFANMLVACLYAHCLTSILHMRRRMLFFLLFLGGNCFLYWLVTFNEDDGLIRALTSFLLTLVMPIMMSAGSLRTRMLRTATTFVALMAADALGGAVCSVFIPRFHEVTIASHITADSNVWDAALAYAIGLTFSILILEGLVAFYARIDDDAEMALESPVVVLLFLSGVLIMSSSYLRAIMLEPEWSERALGIILSVGIGGPLTLAMTWPLTLIVRLDMQAARLKTDRAAEVRQAKHVRDEVEASVRRTLAMRSLRHDLANQMGVVRELARQGRTDEADRYLKTLQGAARNLTGDDASGDDV